MPAPKHSIGQRVYWLGQESGCSGVVTCITEPEPGNFLLYVSNSEGLEDFPIRDGEVSGVWEHTIDLYEKSITEGDAKGSAILRALLLESLKTKPILDCAFCGHCRAECKCPHSM